MELKDFHEKNMLEIQVNNYDISKSYIIIAFGFILVGLFTFGYLSGELPKMVMGYAYAALFSGIALLIWGFNSHNRCKKALKRAAMLEDQVCEEEVQRNLNPKLPFETGSQHESNWRDR